MARGLAQNRQFVRWALADGISVTGTAVSNVVLPIVVFHETGSSAATGGLFALRVIPYILFGSIAGPVADRWNRRRLILGGPIIEGQFISAFNWPLGAALSFILLGIVLLILLAASPILKTQMARR